MDYRGANNIQVELKQYDDINVTAEYELDKIIFDLNSQIDLLSSQADKFDYLVSIGSGVLCGILDVLWVGSFSLERGRNIASKEVDNIVKKTAKLLGCKEDDLASCVKFLEKKFPIPSDGNTPDFGGGLQHHLRDFAHHPTIVGLIFSLLTQFTHKSFGTDVNGTFMVANVTEASKASIGNDVSTKILYGTITWFFHLISDMAGSSSSAGLSGGTGIPGPILSLAKELSALPIFKNISIDGNSSSVFLAKLFNGTLLAQYDDAGKIIKDSVIKFDLRAELGVGVELGRQAIPVVANECIIRGFYLIRRLAIELKENNIRSISDVKQINWNRVRLSNNPTIARMLTIATGVFTTIDVGEVIATQKYFISVSYVGVGRFAIAIAEDVSWCLKARNVKKIRKVYEDIQRFFYAQVDDKIYERISGDMDMDKFGLTVEQTEILYNLEYHKVLNDIRATSLPVGSEGVKTLKQEWLNEWKDYISKNFSAFLEIEDAALNWYTEDELLTQIEKSEPHKTWFRLILLEAILFEPYYPLGVEKDKKGNDVPCKKYKSLQGKVSGIFVGYNKSKGDDFVDSFFGEGYYKKGYVERLRKCYSSVTRELSEVLKTTIISLVIAAGIAIAVIATAGVLAPKIAIVLVGSKFAGLSGMALANACLAYLGGGAIAAGGLGVAGGTATIVAGGAILGVGAGVGVGGSVGAVTLLGKQNIIMQSAKLLVAVREIFLNDEHDTVYSSSVYEKYVENIMDIEKGLVQLKVQAEKASGQEKKELKEKIKSAEDSVSAMKIAKKNLMKFMSSFKEGLLEVE